MSHKITIDEALAQIQNTMKSSARFDLNIKAAKPSSTILVGGKICKVDEMGRSLIHNYTGRSEN